MIILIQAFMEMSVCHKKKKKTSSINLLIKMPTVTQYNEVSL